MRLVLIIALSIVFAAGAFADDRAKKKFLNGVGTDRTTVAQAVDVLGPPDAVLLLKTDNHDSAKEFREYAPAGDTTERELYWYNPGCQPVVLSVKADGKINGANATFYVRGCTRGLDQHLNLPADYSCSRKARAPHCK